MTTSAARLGATSRQEHRHAGKVAFVTGGARGIGAGIVRRLATEGARVTFTYASAEGEADALAADVLGSGGYAAGVRVVDSADRAGIREAIASVVNHDGRLDLVIANAGGGTMKLYGMTKGAVASLVRGTPVGSGCAGSPSTTCDQAPWTPRRSPPTGRLVTRCARRSPSAGSARWTRLPHASRTSPAWRAPTSTAHRWTSTAATAPEAPGPSTPLPKGAAE